MHARMAPGLLETEDVLSETEGDTDIDERCWKAKGSDHRVGEALTAPCVTGNPVV